MALFLLLVFVFATYHTRCRLCQYYIWCSTFVRQHPLSLPLVLLLQVHDCHYVVISQLLLRVLAWRKSRESSFVLEVPVSNSFTSKDSQINGNRQGTLTWANMKTYSSDSTGGHKHPTQKRWCHSPTWSASTDHLSQPSCQPQASPRWDRGYSMSFSASRGSLRNVMYAQNVVALQSPHCLTKEHTGALSTWAISFVQKLLSLQIKVTLGTLGRRAVRKKKWGKMKGKKIRGGECKNSNRGRGGFSRESLSPKLWTDIFGVRLWTCLKK